MKAKYLVWNDRHGELFAYMHSQLLARYAAERLSLGLPPVVPFDDYRQPIPDGYYPGIVVTSQNVTLPASDRPDNTQLQDIKIPPFNTRPGAQISSQETFRDRLQAAAASISANNRPTTISEFSERLEPTDRLATAYFGALHNDGHLMIALHDNHPDNHGCMFWEAAAVRDPVFFRWHGHIDNIFRKYQDALDPYDFADLPPVEIIDIRLIPDSGSQNEVFTEMRTRTLRQTVTSHSGSTFNYQATIDYLSHEDFSYRINVSNKDAAELTVTVRIFLASEQNIDDRTAWIEMDKFKYTLKPGDNSFERSSRDSSVIRHPVWTADMLENPATGPNDSGASPGCRCGWPYTLLLPRGTQSGMDFRLLVLLTKGEDLAPGLINDNSSYCGLADSKYPDQQAIGYPFDRRFTTPIQNWITGAYHPSQLRSTIITIKHVDRTTANISP